MVNPGHEGFLSDFELARVGDEVGVYVYERVGPRAKRNRKPTEVKENKTKLTLSGSGTGLDSPITVSNATSSAGNNANDTTIPMQGTLQFMAVDVLEVAASSAHVLLSVRPVFKQQAHHDLESIIWVLAYVLLRKLLSLASKTEGCEQEKEVLGTTLKDSFGRMKVADILKEKQLVNPLAWIDKDILGPFLDRHMSLKMADLAGLLVGKLERLFSRKRRGKHISVATNTLRNPDHGKYIDHEAEELTHDYLIDLFSQILEPS